LLIDSHAHLDSERYAEDREAMLRRAFEAGVGTVLSIGIGEQAAGMSGALEICMEYNVRTAEGEIVSRGGSAKALRERRGLSAHDAGNRRRDPRPDLTGFWQSPR
jgi:hypothetical protein